MAIEIRRVGPESLDEYGRIPILFRVESILQLEESDGGFDGLGLHEEPVAEPYIKDYGERDKGGAPDWAREFDVSHWYFLIAYDGEKAVGGVAVAHRSAELQLLGGRDDLAAVWDIRVDPDYSGQGIGTRLFSGAVEWARAQGYSQLVVETQNTNVPACRFYARQGCHLGSIQRHAYRNDPDCAHEAMLLWYLDL